MPEQEHPMTLTLGSMVAGLRSCHCDPSSGCAAAADEAAIVKAVAALEDENLRLRSLAAEVGKLSIGSAVLAVLEDNGLGDRATALANFRDRAHVILRGLNK